LRGAAWSGSLDDGRTWRDKLRVQFFQVAQDGLVPVEI